MELLQQLEKQQPELTLERFVEVTNDLLPNFLPDEAAGNRGQESVNPRLVRHYTTQGLLDKPLKRGREARYTYRHLLQLLVLRRLLAEGYSVSSMQSLIGGQPNVDLEKILQGGAHLTVETANPALAFLEEIRARNSPPTPHSAPSSRSIPSSKARSSSRAASLPPPTAATWHRLDILDGLELHVRQDFVLPTTAHERDRLLQLIAQHLTGLNPSRKIPP